MWVMYDSVDAGTVPASAPAVAGYVGGNWPSFQPLVTRCPAARHLSIAVNAGEDADCLDIENGDATPDQAPAWVARQLRRGAWRPCLYSSRSEMQAVWGALQRAGITRGLVRLWVADWTYVPHIPPGYDACQWTDRALGRNLDESLCLDGFFPKAPPKPRPARHASAEIQFDPDTGAWRVKPMPWNAAPLG